MRPKVTIVYHHIAHYREPVFEALMQDRRFEYRILADAKSHTRALAVITPDMRPQWRWRIVTTRSFALFGKTIIWQWGVLKAVLQDPIDAVIFLGDPQFLINWPAALICRLRRIPVLQWGMALRVPEKGLKWGLRKGYLKLFQGHLLYGQWAAKWLAGKGFSKRRMWVVYNSLAPRPPAAEPAADEIPRLKQEICGCKAARLVLHSGRLVKRKELELLFDALALLEARGLQVHAMIIGDGPHRGELERQAVNRALGDRVHFTGACYDEEMLAKWMQAADLAVAPGALGLFAIHAFSSGLPVLTHDGPSGPEAEAVIDHVTGLHFKAGDSRDLAAKMAAMLFPEPLKPSLSLNCRETVRRRYHPRHQTDVFARALETLMQRRSVCRV